MSEESSSISISYRRLRPSDRDVLEKIHCDVFPIRYESEFFDSVVNGRGIVSWGAVDGTTDRLVGFITARLVPARDDAEVSDLVVTRGGRTGSNLEPLLLYILTLGVADSHRNCGIGRCLIGEAVRYASSLAACRAVYLHVISHNAPAIRLYTSVSFECVRRLHSFYVIDGDRHDSYLFLFHLTPPHPCRRPSLLARLLDCLLATPIRFLLWSHNRRTRTAHKSECV